MRRQLPQSSGMAALWRLTSPVHCFQASYFCLAMFLTAFFWGRISDSFGRKVEPSLPPSACSTSPSVTLSSPHFCCKRLQPVIVIGNLASAVTAVLFGLSGSYQMACVVRFAGGFFNGILGCVPAPSAKKEPFARQTTEQITPCSPVPGHQGTDVAVCPLLLCRQSALLPCCMSFLIPPPGGLRHAVQSRLCWESLARPRSRVRHSCTSASLGALAPRLVRQSVVSSPSLVKNSRASLSAARESSSSAGKGGSNPCRPF